MANERLERFTKLLKEIFELDKSDLDFGIYRVMNLRKTQIEESAAGAGMTVNALPDTAPLKQKYTALEELPDAKATLPVTCVEGGKTVGRSCT